MASLALAPTALANVSSAWRVASPSWGAELTSTRRRPPDIPVTAERLARGRTEIKTTTPSFRCSIQDIGLSSQRALGDYTPNAAGVVNLGQGTGGRGGGRDRGGGGGRDRGGDRRQGAGAGGRGRGQGQGTGGRRQGRAYRESGSRRQEAGAGTAYKESGSRIRSKVPTIFV